MIELEYIDRKKRLLTRGIELFILLPLGLFFMACAYTRTQKTITEDLFGFEPYWRTMGWIGLLCVLAIYLLLWRFTISKNGILRIAKNKIELDVNGRTETFYTQNLKSLLVVSDLPFENDERTISQKASRIRFEYQGRMFDFEMRTEKKEDFDNIRPILKYWKENVEGYHEYYR